MDNPCHLSLLVLAATREIYERAHAALVGEAAHTRAWRCFPIQHCAVESKVWIGHAHVQLI